MVDALRTLQMNPIRKLWQDDRAMIDVAALILMLAILGIGTVAGLAVFRNQVVQEFGDAAVAIDSLDQSYEVDIEVSGNPVYHAEYVDPGLDPVLADNPNAAPYCIDLNATNVSPPPGSSEGT